MAKRTGEYRAGDVFSVRLNKDDADQLRWAAKESGHAVSELFRRGLRPILATIRADWWEKHRTEDEWEEVAAVGPVGPRRALRSSFGVSLSGEELHEVLRAAEACGVTISAYLRQAGLALAAAHRAGGTARCGHMSLSGVQEAECGICGPLAVTHAVGRA